MQRKNKARLVSDMTGLKSCQSRGAICAVDAETAINENGIFRQTGRGFRSGPGVNRLRFARPVFQFRRRAADSAAGSATAKGADLHASADGEGRFKPIAASGRKSGIWRTARLPGPRFACARPSADRLDHTDRSRGATRRARVAARAAAGPASAAGGGTAGPGVAIRHGSSHADFGHRQLDRPGGYRRHLPCHAFQHADA